ncbi:MAG: hypothetical protein LAO24_25125 [Acidobacteriia bacterium]|nr:hypothetical protein [Terriglobia bacterium]
MSTAAISHSSLIQQLQTFFHHRVTDLQQLRQSLESGDLAGAQQAYQAIVQLGQKGRFPNSNPFLGSQREQDFEAIGKALQAGDLQGAQQAMRALVLDFHHRAWQPLPAVQGPEPLPAVGPADTPTQSPQGSSVNVVA